MLLICDTKINNNKRGLFMTSCRYIMINSIFGPFMDSMNLLIFAFYIISQVSIFSFLPMNEPHYEKKWLFPYVKTKTQISFAVTAKLISAFVFATWIVQSLYFRNPAFQADMLSFKKKMWDSARQRAFNQQFSPVYGALATPTQ